jgi:hypothetical protein
MAVEIFALDKVPESELVETVKKQCDDEPNFVTAINDRQGAFSVEATFITDDGAGGGAGGASITLQGKMSHFGGPQDQGVTPDEGLAIMDQGDVAARPDLFLAAQPAGTTGLARRLNPDAKYIACRWDFNITPKNFLKTIKVKVSANDKSAEATPVDWGPNIKTGRVADLSPGLEAALGLQTNDDCTVEVPTPSGAQMPAAGEPVPPTVVPLAFDSTVFPQSMTRTLVVLTVTDKAAFWVLNLVGQEEGGQSVLRRAGNKTDVLLSDTTVFPIKPSNDIPAEVADELNKAAPEAGPAPSGPAGSKPTSDADAAAKLVAAAQQFVGTNTRDIPETDNGNFACAWAVNEVARRACGKPISAQDGGKNGLSTVGLFGALQHHTKLGSANDAMAGALIIAPTEGDNHGHVGVIGPIAGNVRDTPVFSNSSSNAKFMQNYTIGKFTDHYTGNGLSVLFFALKADQF